MNFQPPHMRISFRPQISSAQPTARREGFSFVEILAVLAVMGLLMAAAAPGLFSVIRATKLTSAGETILGRVAQAQQLAQTLSSPVELRFYSYTPEDEPGAEKAFRAVQLVDPESESAESGVVTIKSKAMGEAFMLPAGIVVAPSKTLSPLLQSPIGTAGDFFATDSNAEYCALHFYPDGSFKKLTELPESSSSSGGASTSGATGAVSPPLIESFLTIVVDRDMNESPPKNFVCIQLDPYTSKVRLYRP